MKSLIFTRLFVALAMVLGAMAFWGGSTPTVADNSTLVGGWVIAQRDDCDCSYTDYQSCNAGDGWNCDWGGNTPVCAGSGSGECGCTGGSDECSGGNCDITCPSQCG